MDDWSDRDLVEGVKTFYLTVDQVVAGVTAKTELPCHKGCSFCCKDVPPPASLAEWKVIVEFLRAMPSELASAMLSRALDYYAEHAETIEAMEREPERFDELAKTMSYVCPFLVDEACAIYPARPHACRLYGNSFIASRDKMFACHLGAEALLGQDAALANFDGTVAMLRMYPETERSQVFPWYVRHALPSDLLS